MHIYSYIIDIFIYTYIYVHSFLDLKITGGTSDLGLSSLNSCQTWDPDPRSKIPDFQKTILGSRAEILDLEDCPDPRSKIQDFQTTFLGSGAEILDPDPRSKIQDFRTTFLGSRAEIFDFASWMRTVLRVKYVWPEILKSEPFQTWDSQVWILLVLNQHIWKKWRINSLAWPFGILASILELRLAISVYSSNISICTCVETMAIPVSGSVSVEGNRAFIVLALDGKVNHLRNQWQNSKPLWIKFWRAIFPSTKVGCPSLKSTLPQWSATWTWPPAYTGVPGPMLQSNTCCAYCNDLSW